MNMHKKVVSEKWDFRKGRCPFITNHFTRGT